MLKIDVIDKIIPEPIGGAHRHHLVTINNTGDAIENCLNVLSNQHGNELKHSRQERYLQIGRLGPVFLSVGIFPDESVLIRFHVDSREHLSSSRSHHQYYLL